jgi:hypothetical protein
MAHTILTISTNSQLSNENIICKNLQDLDEIEIIKVENIPDAENALFINQISLVIADIKIQGITDFICMVKDDEMFRQMPIFTVIEDNNPQIIKTLFLNGVDNYILENDINEMLSVKIRPLILNSKKNFEMISRLSKIQDKSYS